MVAPQSPGFAGDLYVSFKTQVLPVGLLGGLSSRGTAARPHRNS